MHASAAQYTRDKMHAAPITPHARADVFSHTRFRRAAADAARHLLRYLPQDYDCRRYVFAAAVSPLPPLLRLPPCRHATLLPYMPHV